MASVKNQIGWTFAAALAGAGRFDEAADVLEALADSVALPAEHEIRRQARTLRARLN